MKYRTLGRTGIKVSPYCLGAMMFGAAAAIPTTTTRSASSTRLWMQGSTSSTPPTGTARGESEEIVGKALKGRRDNVVLATKVNGPMGDDPNQQGNSRRWIIREVENSLRRLQTDHIDLYQIHRPSPDTDIEETLSALTDLMRSGKVRAIGSSTFPASDIVEAQWVAERRGLARFRTEQPPYSILNRGIEREVLPVCQRYGMGVAGLEPAGEGHAHRPHPQGPADRPAPRAPCSRRFSDERRLDAVEQIIPLAEEAGLPLTHLAMAFAMAHPGVTARSSARARWNSSTTCSPASRSRSPTRSSTGSTRSFRPAPTSARPTRPPTCLRPSSTRACAAGPPASAPPPDRAAVL